MVLDTSGIRDGHTTLQLAAGLESVKDNLPPFTEPVVCEVDLESHDATIIASIRFSGRFVLRCDRCLEEYHHPVAGEIRLVLQEADGRTGQAREDEVADYYFNSRDYTVDVSPSIYDEIMTSIPLKALCSESCRGIAFKPGTGSDTRVTLPEDQVDPRWEALRKLQKKTLS